MMCDKISMKLYNNMNKYLKKTILKYKKLKFITKKIDHNYFNSEFLNQMRLLINYRNGLISCITKYI